MNRILLCLIAVVTSIGLSSCAITLPRNTASLQRQRFNALTVYARVNIYHYTTYEIRDSVLRGLSQTYKRGMETLSKLAVDDNFPSINRRLGLKDILRIDAEDDYYEPLIDVSAYLILPAAVMIAVLGPIFIRGVP